MIHAQTVLDAWLHLPQEARDITAPIETDEQYQRALELFGVVWDQVGEQPDHPLGSLFLLLQDHLTTYEARITPFTPVAPERVLAFLMEQHSLKQVQVAGILGITQGNVSRLLNAQTRFTAESIQKLAEHFRVNPAVFLGTPEREDGSTAH